MLLGVLVAFTAPKIYEMRKDEIDNYMAMAMEKMKEVYKQIEKSIQKIPSAKKQTKKTN